MDEKIVKCNRCGRDRFRNELERYSIPQGSYIPPLIVPLCRECISEIHETKRARNEEACGWVK